MDYSTSPIGLFDSGVGGTSIWKEIHLLMPAESTIYLADSKNAPYGLRPKEEIISLSIKNTDYLLSRGCKLIVVACNTATTNAIKALREKYDVPFIGIEPAIKPAAIHTTTGSIGILATKGTLSSDLFAKTVSGLGNIKVIEQVGHNLVELIESGKLESEEMNQLLRRYIEPMLQANIDYLVLGCTHYPYLIPQLQKILPPYVKIIDSGEAVARQTQNILQKNNLLNNSATESLQEFYTNGSTEVLQELIGSNFTATYANF